MQYAIAVLFLLGLAALVAGILHNRKMVRKESKSCAVTLPYTRYQPISEIGHLSNETLEAIACGQIVGQHAYNHLGVCADCRSRKDLFEARVYEQISQQLNQTPGVTT